MSNRLLSLLQQLLGEHPDQVPLNPDEHNELLNQPPIRRDILITASLSKELRTLGQLFEHIKKKEKHLTGRDLGSLLVQPKAFQAVREPAPRDLARLKELREHAYGKSVTLRAIDSEEEITYRIAQAEYGFAEIGVLNRSSPVAGVLTSVDLGDTVSFKQREWTVVHRAFLGQPRGTQVEADFGKADLDDSECPSTSVRAVRDTWLRIRAHLVNVLKLEDSGGFDYSYSAEDIRPGDQASLGANFYIRTTRLQEELQRREIGGLLVVHGIAGSGKTSVALGRTKMVCDRPEDQGGDPDFFQPQKAVGYVLNSQLSTYLKRTCAALYLHSMPIQEFRELRADLRRLRFPAREDEGYKGNADPGPARLIYGRMAWLRVVERAMAVRYAYRLREALTKPPEEGTTPTIQRVSKPRTPEQIEALKELWQSFQDNIEAVTERLLEPTEIFATTRLVMRLDDCRRRFAEDLERSPAWSGEGKRQDEVEQNRILRQNVRNALRERMIRALRLAPAYSEALSDPNLETSLRPALTEELRAGGQAAIEGARRRLDGKQLCDEDVDVLLAVSQRMSLGYRGRGDPISHLVEVEYHNQVFIDEYQDFNEVQLFLMGEMADPKYRAVTVVGDLCQRLTAGEGPNLAQCFPMAKPGETEPQRLLENMRQTGPLARLSQAVRTSLLGEPAIDIKFSSDGEQPTLTQAGPDQTAVVVGQEILRVPRSLSVTVLCPSRELAAELQAALHDELKAEFRDSLLSSSTDLVRRDFVHFATPLEAKGLEFDAVIVTHADQYDFADSVQANLFYVAVSRPRQIVRLVAGNLAQESPLGRLLEQGALTLVDLP